MSVHSDVAVEPATVSLHTRRWRVRWDWFLLPVILGVLMAPMLFTSRSYAADWANHLWLVWQQSLNIKELGHPSYFVQSNFGAFYPWFAFNGGTLYAAAGAVAAVSGHPLASYLATYLVAFVAAYGGCLWMGCQLGLSGWRAHIPAILFVTSSFYVAGVYGRGDFPEVVGTSAVPLVAAGGLYLLRAPRWHPFALLSYVAAVVFLTGSHSITVLWGVTFLVGVTIMVLIVNRFRWRPSRKRTLAVLGVTAASVGVNAWYLVPAVLYQSRILINDEYPGITQTSYTSTGALFGIVRDTYNPPTVMADIQAQLPTLAILWALVLAVLCWRRMDGLARRLTIGLTVLLTAVVWLVLTPHLLARLGPWQHVEFPCRLVTYATLTACGLVAVVLLALGRTRRGRVRTFAEAALAVVTLVSVGLAIQQMWNAPSFLANRTQVFASAVIPPSTFYYGPDYADRSRPVVTRTLPTILGGDPLATQPGVELPASPYRTVYRYPIVVGHSGFAVTNVKAGPYMVKVTGATPVARTANGGMIVSVNGRPGQHKVISVTTADSVPLRAGVILTIGSIIGLVLLLGAVSVSWWRRNEWVAGSRATSTR